MVLIDKYQLYRKKGKKLNDLIIKRQINRELLTEAAKKLGIPLKNNTFIFNSEDEMSVLMDFAIYECAKTGKNCIALYKEDIDTNDNIEKELLEGMLLSYTSLFKITSIIEKENKIMLADVLNKKEDISFIDFGLSMTGTPGMLIFTRIIPLKDFSMTSGISFAFPENSEENLKNNYEILKNKINSDSDSLKRFAAFYKMSLNEGLETSYI